MDIRKKLIRLDTEIRETFKERFKVSILTVNSSRVAPPEILPPNLFDFYKQQQQFRYQWETLQLMNDKGEKIQGLINIFPLEDVLKDWRDFVYFDFQKEEDVKVLKNFKIVDYFSDEVYAGFLLTDEKSDAMYVKDSSEPKPKPMGLDFNGYLELMFAARGFGYWQLVVLHLAGSSLHKHNVEQFKTYMPQIFPDFKWEEFVALYERVRIK